MPLFGCVLGLIFGCTSCRLLLYFCTVHTFALFVGFLVVVLWLPSRLLLAIIIFEFVACLTCMLSLVGPHRIDISKICCRCYASIVNLLNGHPTLFQASSLKVRYRVLLYPCCDHYISLMWSYFDSSPLPSCWL